MLMNAIPSFRLEKDVVEAEINVLRALGVELRCGVEVGKDMTIPQLREQGYKGFYLAIGLQHGGALAVPGGDAEGVRSGMDFMRDVNLREEVPLRPGGGHRRRQHRRGRGPHRGALRRGEGEPVLSGGV